MDADGLDLLDLEGLEDLDDEALLAEISKTQAELEMLPEEDQKDGDLEEAAELADFLDAFSVEVEKMDVYRLLESYAKTKTELNLIENKGKVERILRKNQILRAKSKNKKGAAKKDVYCLCQLTSGESADLLSMICCDICNEWFHGVCVGITRSEELAIDKFACSACQKKSPHNRTSYKSQREVQASIESLIPTWTLADFENEIKAVEETIARLQEEDEKTDSGDEYATVEYRDEQLVKAVRSAMRKHRFQKQDVVMQAGISGGVRVLNSWLTNKHVEDMQEVQDSLRSWLETYGERVPQPTKDVIQTNVAESFFRHDYNIGDKVDAQDASGVWYTAAIRDVRPGAVLVHYKSFSNGSDEWITDPERIAARGFKAQGKRRAESKHGGEPSKKKRKTAPTYQNVDLCIVCANRGSLICCDGCPASYHMQCLGLTSVSSGNWYCPDCEENYKRIPVWKPGESAVLMGDKAPFKKDLDDWLKQHPGWEAWSAKAALKLQQAAQSDSD